MKGELEKSIYWHKIKNADTEAAEGLLRANEDMSVSACARFLSKASGDHAWILKKKSGEINAVLLSSRSTIMPVLCGRGDIPQNGFPFGFLKKKKVHSIQGLTEDVKLLEKIMTHAGRVVADFYDYDLMSLDTYPDTKNNMSFPSNLVLCVPQLTDLDAIAPLQAAYEKEEVLPKGSSFSPAASRMNIANIIANGQILAARINGMFVGKINVSAVSFTRYQVGGVYVHPDFRSQGIAGYMAREFISSLIEKRRGVSLFVKKNNLPACSLYKSLGFNIIGSYRITYY
ncbi:MAG: GNAT family N-acetyltransferase [Treponema sp.]|nr:GNAT family N-acetyltransferase [Treponema sp.]